MTGAQIIDRPIARETTGLALGVFLVYIQSDRFSLDHWIGKRRHHA
jgi:hypothetical protein